jgi:hypothetical protein
MISIIGLSGYARTGKDTLADFLAQRHGFEKKSFADPMREALYALDPNIDVDGWRSPLSSAVDAFGWDGLKAISTEVRPLLQRFGTEVGRAMWGTDFWVDAAMRRVVGPTIFADVRFPNEADAVRNAGGVVWRVQRSGVEPANGHASEHALDGYVFDAVIDNSGSLTDLYAKAEILLSEADRG